LEGNGRGLFEDTILAFVRDDWENNPGYEPGTFTIEVTCVTAEETRSKTS